MSININEKLYPQNAGKGALKKKDIVNRKTIKDTFQAIFFSSLLYPCILWYICPFPILIFRKLMCIMNIYTRRTNFNKSKLMPFKKTLN